MAGVLFLCSSISDSWLKLGIQIVAGASSYFVTMMLLREEIIMSYFKMFTNKIKVLKRVK